MMKSLLLLFFFAATDHHILLNRLPQQVMKMLQHEHYWMKITLEIFSEIHPEIQCESRADEIVNASVKHESIRKTSNGHHHHHHMDVGVNRHKIAMSVISVALELIVWAAVDEIGLLIYLKQIIILIPPVKIIVEYKCPGSQGCVVARISLGPKIFFLVLIMVVVKF